MLWAPHTADTVGRSLLGSDARPSGASDGRTQPAHFFILLHPPLPLVGVSIWMERGMSVKRVIDALSPLTLREVEEGRQQGVDQNLPMHSAGMQLSARNLGGQCSRLCSCEISTRVKISSRRDLHAIFICEGLRSASWPIRHAEPDDARCVCVCV